jgi:hypothetical protein
LRTISEAMPVDYTIFTLPSGAVVAVESSLAPLPTRGGPQEATGAAQRVAVAWSDGMNMVAEMAGQAVEQLRKATASAKEVSVEFGVNISGKTGIVLVEGTVAANLKVC